MRFTKKFVQEVGGHVSRLGLQHCSVCGSETGLHVSRLPVVLQIGGFHHEDKSDPRHDPEANVLFMVLVECTTCGHSMLFHSQRFRGGDEPILFRGPQELEDDLEPPE